MNTPTMNTPDLFNNKTNKARYEAYNRLQAAAYAFGESLSIPELVCGGYFYGHTHTSSPTIQPPIQVVVGGQSDGKSSLLEAFLGFRFNVRGMVERCGVHVVITIIP